METLSFKNIFGEEQINGLFDDEDTSPLGSTEEASAEEQPDESVNSETEKTTEVVKPENLFDGDIEEDKQPESVGSEKNKEDKGDTVTEEDSGTSPNNFYSSIANACAVDGIFPNLDEESINSVEDAEGLHELFEKEVNARLDEKQRRIAEALENGVEPNQIRQYEAMLKDLNDLTDAQLQEESDRGEMIRKRLIYLDLINKGYKEAKAEQLAQRAIDNGTDVEDAKEALQSNKEFYQASYNGVLREAQKEAEKERAEREKIEAKLKKDMLEDKSLMGDLTISDAMRRKAYDSIRKPVYKDPDSGQYMTAIQRYESEHRSDFMKYVGLFFTLTNGFTDFESFTKGKVKKEVRKGLAELQQKINPTSRNSDGSYRAVHSSKDDPESFISSGFKLAL